MVMPCVQREEQAGAAWNAGRTDAPMRQARINLAPDPAASLSNRKIAGTEE
jgi:hypothetical protein